MVKLDGELFLTPEVFDGEIDVKVTGEGGFVKQQAGDHVNKSLAIPVEWKGKIFRWLPNERSQSNVRAVLGDDTSTWPNSIVRIWKVERFAYGVKQEIVYGRVRSEGK